MGGREREFSKCSRKGKQTSFTFADVCKCAGCLKSAAKWRKQPGKGNWNAKGDPAKESRLGQVGANKFVALKVVECGMRGQCHILC